MQNKRLVTANGMFDIHFNSGTQVYIYTRENPSNILEEYPQVRGSSIYFTCHFKKVDGKWQVENRVYAKKVDLRGSVQRDATTHEDKKVAAEVIAELTKYESEYPEHFQQAEIDSIQGAINRVESKKEELQKEIGKLDAERDRLIGERMRAEGKLPPASKAS